MHTDPVPKALLVAAFLRSHIACSAGGWIVATLLCISSCLKAHKGPLPPELPAATLHALDVPCISSCCQAQHSTRRAIDGQGDTQPSQVQSSNCQMSLPQLTQACTVTQRSVLCWEVRGCHSPPIVADAI